MKKIKNVGVVLLPLYRELNETMSTCMCIFLDSTNNIFQGKLLCHLNWLWRKIICKYVYNDMV